MDKHDLSFDLTKLDFQALLRTASIAYVGTRCEVERRLSDLQNTLSDEDYKSAGFPLNAERLARAAEQLAIAAGAYHMLLSAVDRSKLIVTNKPNQEVT